MNNKKNALLFLILLFTFRVSGQIQYFEKELKKKNDNILDTIIDAINCKVNSDTRLFDYIDVVPEIARVTRLDEDTIALIVKEDEQLLERLKRSYFIDLGLGRFKLSLDSVNTGFYSMRNMSKNEVEYVMYLTSYTFWDNHEKCFVKEADVHYKLMPRFRVSLNTSTRKIIYITQL